MTTDRPTWVETFFALCEALAKRATCTRLAVGCVLVGPDHRILSTGYNGSHPGTLHCIDPDVGCLLHEGHCVRCLHAEANAVVHAARAGIPIKGARAYVLYRPCVNCANLLVGAGVTEIHYRWEYNSYITDPGARIVREICFDSKVRLRCWGGERER